MTTNQPLTAANANLGWMFSFAIGLLCQDVHGPTRVAIALVQAALIGWTLWVLAHPRPEAADCAE